MSSVPPTPFVNIQVTVVPNPDKASKDKYIVTCDPDKPKITQKDTVINYQIVSPASGIIFTGMNSSPDNVHQLSKPSVSESGLIMTFSDACTEKLTMDIDLKFKDKDNNSFGHDPQVENDPNP